MDELNAIAKKPNGKRQLEDILRTHLGLSEGEPLPEEDRERADDKDMSGDSGIVWEIMKHEYGR